MNETNLVNESENKQKTNATGRRLSSLPLTLAMIQTEMAGLRRERSVPIDDK